MRLTDQSIVVTGASSGLGKAMADAFVAEGASVAYAARGADDLEAAVDAVAATDPPGEATAIPTDVRSPEAVHRLFDLARERHGPVDVVVNNAGVPQYKVNPDHTYRPVESVPISTWRAVLATNLEGAFLCTRKVLPSMRSRDAGRLIHTSSGHGVTGRADRSAYVASKFGLEGFHESLARELEDTGVDSMTIRPPGGGVCTERAARYGRDPDSFTHDDPTVVAEAAVQLAAGAGENGGRYRATVEGDGFVPYSRADGD